MADASVADGLVCPAPLPSVPKKCQYIRRVAVASRIFIDLAVAVCAYQWFGGVADVALAFIRATDDG